MYSLDVNTLPLAVVDPALLQKKIGTLTEKLSIICIQKLKPNSPGAFNFLQVTWDSEIQVSGQEEMLGQDINLHFTSPVSHILRRSQAVN